MAARPLKRGEPVTISYGEHDSAQFAGIYGFVPRANPHDCIRLSLEQLLHLLQVTLALTL